MNSYFSPGAAPPAWQTNGGIARSWIFSDLDKPGVLAIELFNHGVSTVAELVGTGTANPLAIPRQYMTRIFFRAKTLNVGGTVPGIADSVATLQTDFVTQAAFTKPREALISSAFFGFQANGGGVFPTAYYLDLRPNGFIHGGEFYPTLLAQSDRGVGSAVSTNLAFASGTDVLGALNFYDRSCDLYGNLAGQPGGDMTITEDTLWP